MTATAGLGCADGDGATGFELAAGFTHSDWGGGGVFISSDHRRSIELGAFSTGAGGAGSEAGAATGTSPAHPLNALMHVSQQSPSGLGAAQTAQSRTAGCGSAAAGGAVEAVVEASSRPQHSQCRSGVSDSV
jgi:hypothetical protein